MNYVNIILSPYGSYSYETSSSIKMDILGFFLCSVGCYHSIYKEWALADKTDPHSRFGYSCGANTVFLEEEENLIYLSDNYSEEKCPSRLKMTREQFVQLLDDWQEKVCKHKPKQVTIIYENDQFRIETTNDPSNNP